MIELMRALHDIRPAKWHVLAASSKNQLLAKEQKSSWYKENVVGAKPVRGQRSLQAAWQNEYNLRRLTKPGTIVHRTYHPVLDLLPASTPVVETLHDLWDFFAEDERGPRAALRRHLKRRALARADQIICVSQSTRSFLGDLWPDLAERAIVIPHGTTTLSDRPTQIDRTRPFFLFVGRRDRYKNFGILLQALAQMRDDAELLCFGGGELAADERSLIAQLSLSGRVQQLGGDDHLLAGHYKAARALLYPSLHEGFGLPLLEAMSLGCPVLAAPLTSLPEVGGDAALYAASDDAEAWANGMTLLLEDEDARNRAIMAGIKRAATFSWKETARQHVAAYDGMGWR